MLLRVCLVILTILTQVGVGAQAAPPKLGPRPESESAKTAEEKKKAEPRIVGANPNGVNVGTGNVETLTLDRALQKAMSASRTMQQNRLSLESAELSYDDAWSQMFTPGVSIELSNSSTYTLAQLPIPARDKSLYTHGYPTTTAALKLGSYTLFNFWKDYIGYEQARLGWQRAKEQFVEGQRALRNQVILAFYKVLTDQEKLDAGKLSLDLANSIADTVRANARGGKATEDDLNSSEVDALNAKTAYQGLEYTLRTDVWALNQLLGDPIGTSYRVQGALKYLPLRLDASEAMRIYMESAPAIKDARLGIKNAELSLDLAEKNRLPLPTVTISGLTFSYTTGYFKSENSLSTGSAASPGNIELGTSIALTLPLWGPGGFLNHRAVQSARISVTSAELNYQSGVERDQVSVYTQLTSIRQAEEQVETLRKSSESTSGLLLGMLPKLRAKQISRLELRDAILQARTAHLDLSDAILNHLTSKLALAELIGVDQLPGDSL